MTKQEYRYRNALQWIRFVAGLHYMGDAFNPEHMRGLANLAADALTGQRELPDFETASRKAGKKARKMARQFHKILEEDDRGDDGGMP